MTDRRPLTCFLSQFAMACNLACVYALMTTEQAGSGRFFPLAMLVYAPLLYLLDHLFLRRERSMLALTVLNGLCGGLMLGARLLLDPWQGFADLAFTAAFLAWLTVRGCQFALEGAPLRGTLLTLDCGFLLLVAVTATSAALGWPIRRSLTALCGLSASIITAAVSRSPRTLRFRGWLAVGGAFGALMLGMGLFVTVLAAPAASGLVALWTAVTTGVKGFFGLLLGGLTWLLSLFPGAQAGDPGHYEVPEVWMPEDVPVPETSPVVGAVLLVLLAVGAVFLLVRFAGALRRLRLGKPEGREELPRPKRERTSLLKGAARLLRAWSRAFRLRWRLWKGRDTAVGLYFLLEHRCRRSPWRKRPGETPREFLLRMAGAARTDETLRRTLEDLARQTDAALYAGRTAAIPRPDAAMIRRRMGAAVWGQYLRDLRDRFRTK